MEKAELEVFEELINQLGFLDYLIKKDCNHYGLSSIINDYKIIQDKLEILGQLNNQLEENRNEIEKWARGDIPKRKGGKAIVQFDINTSKKGEVIEEIFTLSRQIHQQYREIKIYLQELKEYNPEISKIDSLYRGFTSPLENELQEIIID